MGPKVRYLGPEVPAEELIWQDPVAGCDYATIGQAMSIAALKAKILATGLSVSRAGRHRLGLGLDLPRSATSVAAPMAPASASPPRRTGRSTSRRSWPRC
jgi:hypothetical protein